jgi:hypothetical protein
MRKVEQTKLHSEKVTGNCMAASFASILELPLSEVPEFEDMENVKWFLALEKWLYDLGYEIVRFNGEMVFKGYYLVSGNSPRGDFLHQVVYKNGEMVHDPHPSNDGINSHTNTWLITPMDPSVRRFPNAKID